MRMCGDALRLRRSASLLLAIALLVLFTTPEALLAAPLPNLLISGPSSARLGESVVLTLRFENAGDTTGYGPFLDLVFPATGSDGNDGLNFAAATYLGSALDTTTRTFPPGTAPTCVVHPYAKLPSGQFAQVCGTPGDRLVVLRLPFGSFTPDQPAIDIEVRASLSNQADLGAPLTVSGRTGFQYGATPLDDWCCDPVTLSDADPDHTGWSERHTVTPTVITLAKAYSGPENETATGPNFLRTYTLSVDVANGQTITGLTLVDELPPSLAFQSIIASTPPGAVVVAAPPTGAANNPPANTLEVSFPPLTGGPGVNDATVSLSVFGPRLDANGTPVIDPFTGNDATAPNNLRAAYSWTPLDLGDDPITTAIDLTGPEHTLNLKSLATQKQVRIVTDTGTGGYTPGDVLEYTIELQISDYFAFDGLELSDRFGDGLRFDPGFVPTLRVNGNGYSTSAAPFDTTSYTVDASQIGNDQLAGTDGSTNIVFRISDELAQRGHSPRLVGGCINPTSGSATPDCAAYNDGATTATVVFRAVIQDQFSDTYPSGDQSVDEGDTLGNTVAASGFVLNPETLGRYPGDPIASDTSGADVAIRRGGITKTIYALNGSTTFTVPVEVAAGDVVTYRLSTTLPSSDIEELRLVDYLPLPTFLASEVTGLDPDLAGTIPPAGVATYGPNDTLHLLAGSPTPLVTTSASGNSVTFDYGSFDDIGNQRRVIELLLSVTVEDEPTADGLFITNQLRRFSGSTNSPDAEADEIVQLKITQPVLVVKKGVIGSDNPGATYSAPTGPVAFAGPGSAGPRWSGTLGSDDLASTPVDADIVGVDANDLVSFAIVLENVGSGTKGAFDLAVTDTLPPGLTVPPTGINLQAHNGKGEPQLVTYLGPTGTSNDLFGAGIQLVDGADKGACQKYHPDDGSNIIVITYDLMVDPGIAPGAPVLNRGVLTRYAGKEGGANHVDAGSAPFDRAQVTADLPTLSKGFVGSSEAHTLDSTTPPQATIGEVLTYSLAYSIPEGLSAGLTITDTLPAGLAYLPGTAYVAFVSDSAASMTSTTLSGTGLHSTGNSSNITPSFPLPTDAVTLSGQNVQFSLGDVRNLDNDLDDEFVVIRLRAVVGNAGGAAQNDAGAPLDNLATAASTGLPAPVDSNSVRVQIVEPALTISKVVVEPQPTEADAGDVVTYTVTLENALTETSATAYDIVLSDTVPSKVTLDPTSLAATGSAGATGLSTGAAGNTATLNITSLAPGATATFTYAVVLSDLVTPGELIVNTARVAYTSLPGPRGTGDATPGAAGSPTGERSGLVGTGPNPKYTGTSQATVTVFGPAPTKSVIATSEPDTEDTRDGVDVYPRPVAIGEVVTYRLAVRLAEGTSPSLNLQDPLPRGLNYIPGTARLAFVSTTAGKLTSTNSLIAGPGLTLTGNTPDVLPDFVLDDSLVSLSNNTVTFTLGSVTNTETDADAEYVVLTFQAVVDNEGSRNSGNSNDANEQLANSFNVRTGNTTLGTSAPVRLLIVEPRISIDKRANGSNNNTSGDAGNTINYSLTFNNTGTASSTAYELVLTDTLPLQVSLDPASIAVAGVTDAQVIVESNAFTVTIARLAPDTPVTVTYSGVIADDVTPTLVMRNVARLTYTSLPGERGTGDATPGVAGSGTGERIGVSASVINDHVVSDGQNVTVPGLTLNKYIAATSEAATAGTSVAIGEVVRYRLSANIPEGIIPDLVLTDTLPLGLTYLGNVKVGLITNNGNAGTDLALENCPDSAALNRPGSSANSALNQLTCTLPSSAIGSEASATATTLAFSLGTITNADRDTNREYAVLEFDALVDNSAAAGNDAGDQLINQFAARTTGGFYPAVAGSTLAVTVVEPQISITKTRVGTGDVDAGDLVTYEVFIANSGASTATTAFDLLVTDMLPPGLANPVIVSTTSSPGVVGSLAAITAGMPTWQATLMPAGATAMFSYTATIQDTAVAGQLIVNTARASYTSLPGTNGSTTVGVSQPPGLPGSNTGERTGTGTPAQNDLFAAAGAGVSIGAPIIVKLPIDPAQYTIGDLVTYTLRVTLPEGTTQGVAVSDNLPAGMVYVNHSVDPSGFSGPLPTPALSAPGGDGDAVTLTFGALTIPSDNNPANNSFTVEVVARVLDIPANRQGILLSNTATLQYTHPGDGPTTVAAPDPVSITVIEPILELAKSFDRAEALPGSVVTVTLVLTNTGSSAAFEATLSDPLSKGLFTVVTPTVTAADFGASVVDTGGDWLVSYSATAALPPGASRSFTFEAALRDDLAAGTPRITNIATAAATSLPGSDPHERLTSSGPASADLQVVAPDIALTKLGPATTSPGTTLVYTLAYTNTGGVHLTGVTITETVPLNTSFDASASAPGWNCPTGAAGDTCTYSVGDLARGASGATGFAVALPASVPSGLDTIVNSARIGEDGSSGPEKTLTDNTADLTIALDAAPELVLDNSTIVTSPQAGQPITYTLTYTNTGPQAATGVVITNTVPLETRADLAASSAGWVCAAGIDPGATCSFNLGGLDVGASGQISFVVIVNDPFVRAGLELRHQARIADDGLNGVEANMANNSDDVVFRYSPTAVGLMSLTASYEAGGVMVRWSTGSEINNMGFRLLRGPDTTRASALPLEAAGLIPSQGDLVGADYSYFDAEIGPESPAHYWLIAIDSDGSEAIFGPVGPAPRLTERTTVYIPVISAGGEP